MDLRKTCNHPYLVTLNTLDPALTPAQQLEQLVEASGKLSLLDKMMARLKERGHRVLVYSQFTRTLDLLEDWLVGRGWGYLRLDGEEGCMGGRGDANRASG
jgi:chromodomain-helicase-DNA-binding protein 4